MTQTFEAIYDGVVFRPEKQVKIKPNTRVQIIVEVEEESNKTVADVASHLFGVIDVESPIDVNMQDKGISEAEALTQRHAFATFAEDWESPEMDAYDKL
jgi:predicted DNA-binding antitoxin AbrB/MazE fold protein